ncbi:MAG: Mov34/MPN/PAD-1 family protein [Candidatus Heimdallarchaeota archaeon]
MTIHIRKSELKKIQNHAVGEFPYECCGILIGTSAPSLRVTEARKVPNTNRTIKTRRYNIDPMSYRKIEEETEENGIEILGIYHSHPNHPATPSEFDLNNAFPNFSYIIQSIDDGKVGAITSWRLDPSRMKFYQEPIRIT